MHTPHWKAVINAMKSGGYYDNIMAAGPELDRVKSYIRAFAKEQEIKPSNPLLNPAYPVFPGLNHRPFPDPAEFEAVRILEQSFDTIREEACALKLDSFFRYIPRPTGLLSKIWLKLNPEYIIKTWTMYVFYYMGVNFETKTLRCPETMKIIQSLPDVCLDYPWNDAIFSMHEPGTHLPAHCSIDNLRVRIHLGINIPEDCEIRVGDETRTWEEGKCLLIEDSIEHEVWNRSDRNRLILIVDLWHPDLTAIEREALTAGFRKSDVRMTFYQERIRNTSAPAMYVDYLVDEFRRQDEEDVFRKYWNSQGA